MEKLQFTPKQLAIVASLRVMQGYQLHNQRKGQFLFNYILSEEQQDQCRENIPDPFYLNDKELEAWLTLHTNYWEEPV